MYNTATEDMQQHAGLVLSGSTKPPSEGQVMLHHLLKTNRGSGPASPSLLQRCAFTMVEVLIVIVITAILAAMVLGLVGSLGDSKDRLQVSATCAHYTNALLTFLQSSGSLPIADDLYYIDYDPALDIHDPLQNTDSAYAKWPLTNKLIARSGLSIDHDLFQNTGKGTTQRLFDAWDQEIRYVIGDAKDDNNHMVEGLFPDWNWDSDKGAPIHTVYPYVYSYGPANSDGSDTSLWVRKVE